ncbi:MAG: twin-arginine translocase subunit TatC [Candidatus Binatia bacterium]
MEDAKLPLTAHLEELRSRLIKSLAAIGVAFIGCYQLVEELMNWLLEPIKRLDPSKVQIIGTGLAEAFFTKLKVAFIAGIFLASPVILYQIWKFVAPGLYEHERRYVKPFVFFGTLFFLSGAYFCYRLVFPTAFGFFLAEYSSIAIEPFLRVSEYLSFSSRLLLAFGVVFELPVVTFFLARTGIVTHRSMISLWRYAVITIFIVAAILTPGPDVASQMLMAAPLVILYLLSIGVAYFFARPQTSAAEESAGVGA